MIKNTRNSLSVSYTIDKTNQVGLFVLKLMQDNLPVKASAGARIYATQKDNAKIFNWANPIYKDGQIFLKAKDFQGISQRGTYYLRVILKSGEIFPSSGKCILKLQKDLSQDVGGIQIIQGINGKDGKSQSLDDIKVLVKEAVDAIPVIVGKDGKNGADGAPGKNGKDGLSAYQIAIKDGFKGTEEDWLASLKGAKGDKGDSITGPKGDKGDSITGPAGQDGKDAPTVTAVSYADDKLTFTFSDGSRLSTAFVMPKPVNGKDGKDAPTVTAVSYADDKLTFTFSDGSRLSTAFVMPKPVNGKDGKNGADGAPGKNGKDGLSAYQIAIKDGFKGTEQEWLASLKGAKGDKGDKGDNGTQGVPGKDGTQGAPGKDGKDGLSAYQLAVQQGFKGTEQEWLASLKGKELTRKNILDGIYSLFSGDSYFKTRIGIINTLDMSPSQLGNVLEQITRENPNFGLGFNTDEFANPDAPFKDDQNLSKTEGNYTVTPTWENVKNSTVISLKPVFDELDTKLNKQVQFVDLTSDLSNITKHDWNVYSLSISDDMLILTITNTVEYQQVKTSLTASDLLPVLIVPTCSFAMQTNSMSPISLKLYKQIFRMSQTTVLNSEDVADAYNKIYIGRENNGKVTIMLQIDKAKFSSNDFCKQINAQYPFTQSVDLKLHIERKS